MLVLLVVSLFTARVVFRTLGVDNYGIYNLVGGIIVFFSFLNESLLGATGRFITAEIADGTIESQRRVFTIALKCHAFISLIILVGGETIGLWFLNNILNIPSERLFAANIVYQLSVISAILGVLQAPFGSLIVSHERMSIYAYFSIIDVLFKLIIIYLVQAIVGDKLVIYAILIFVIGIINYLIYAIYCLRVFPDCRYIRHIKDRTLIKDILKYMSCSLFGIGTNVATNQGVMMLVNIYYSVVVNAAMGICNSVTNMVKNFTSNFQVAFRPQITKYYVTHNIIELNKLTVRASRYSAYLVIVFLVPISFEIKDFLTLWLGDFPQYTVEFVVLTLICMYFESIATPLIYLLGSNKDIRKYTIVVSVLYSLNFFLSWIVLAFGFEPWFVMVVKLVVDIFLVWGRFLLMKNQFYNFPIKYWIKVVIGDSILILIIPILVGIILLYLNITFIWLRLIVVSSVCFIATVLSVFFIGLNENERSFLKQKLSSRVFK